MLELPLRHHVPLAPYTTFHIGGPADYLLEVTSQEQLRQSLRWAEEKGIPWLILGGGSNVLISDRGIRGLVIINRSQGWQKVALDDFSRPTASIASRWQSTFPLEPPARGKKVAIKVNTGTSLKALLFELAAAQITGLEWFVGIPGTVGGAIKNNIHGGPEFFSNFLLAATIWRQGREERYLPQAEDFDYDFSPFDSQTVLLEATLLLFEAKDNRGPLFLREWGKTKLQNQPQNSAGCVFQNLSIKEQRQLGLPSPSWGYIIDKILHLKGRQIGGAQISLQHAAFIINADGQARAKDVLALINLIKEKSQQVLGIEPRLEIQLLGFDEK